MIVNRILILIVQPNFNLLNRYSAVSSVICSMAELLSEMNIEVYVNQYSLVQWQGLKVADSTLNQGKKQSKLVRMFPPKLREAVKQVMLLKSNAKLVEQIGNVPKPNLILNWTTMANDSAVKLAEKWLVPIVSIYDNPLVEEYTYLKGFAPPFKRLIEGREEKVLAKSKSVIVYSHAVSDYLKKKHGLKTNYHYKAFTDFQRMRFGHVARKYDQVCFAYIGSFFNWHKVDELIEVFEELSKTYLNCVLFLIGDGPEHERIKANVRNSRIIFTGKMDGKELDALLEKIHIGIIPNALWFHAPVKLFQYSAANLAVLARRTPTIEELTGGQSYFSLFENASELKMYLTQFVSKPASIQEDADKALDYIKINFSKNSYRKFFENVFAEL